MSGDVLELREIDRTMVALVGGKGAQLGELSGLPGARVPEGFCVTTGAFARALAEVPSIGSALERMDRLSPDDAETIRALACEIRIGLQGVAIHDPLAAAITRAVAGLGDVTACAVRSSATAEDLATASFAGQYDSYLNVTGPAEILRCVVRCWASLFSERAVSYRLRTGVVPQTVRMAVIVQRMVAARAAGVLFTADPVSGNRAIARVEAGLGLGEAVVSGRVDPDGYRVRDGRVIERTLPAERRDRPVLTDAQVAELVGLGRRIEMHLGLPQDIEWCRDAEGFAIVQSRPITTLYPIPVADDAQTHVYLSVGHQQMMTDAMKPLGLSLFQLTAKPRMYEAGGRLFVDVARALELPVARGRLLDVMGHADPLTADALQSLVDRGDLLDPAADEEAFGAAPGEPPALLEADPDLVAELIARNEASIAALRRRIDGLSGPALVAHVLDDIQELKRILFDPQSVEVLMAGMQAAAWLDERLGDWLGERNVADALTLSVPHNVTSEMGLALLDVADAVRPHPEVVTFLAQVEDHDGREHRGGRDFLDELTTLPGGGEARDAIGVYLDAYGMRCAGEIDITRPRWSERPAALVPMILADVRHFGPGAAARRRREGRARAAATERELLARVRALPDGEDRARDTARMIDRVRTFTGYREYPKYGMISRYFVYKQALLGEAERLVREGVIDDAEDVFHLTLTELHDVARTRHVDRALIQRRREAFRADQSLIPPRVLTSEGEVLSGAYRRGGLPAGALVGLAVCAGVVEGRARVVHDVTRARLDPGDILVTAATDPSWAPLFVTAAGLVTEVGGLMTHGAVIAREYGLPTVVSVPAATQLIADGQRIRVHGADGYVEILA